MFSVKYQLFLNDIYYWGSTEILTYAMVKTFLEDIDFALTTQNKLDLTREWIGYILISIGQVFEQMTL